MVSMSNHVYEPGVNAAYRQWFNERNRPTYFFGPILPPDVTVRQGVNTSFDRGEVQVFLDKVLQSYGESTMLYVDKLFPYPMYFC